jgi:outer membrane receptor for monomeric catechols
MSIAGNLVINLMGNTQHLNRALTRSASRIRAFSATSQRSLTAFSTTTAASLAAVGTGAAVAGRAVRNMTVAMGGGLVVATGLSFKRLISFDDVIRSAGARTRTTA